MPQQEQLVRSLVDEYRLREKRQPTFLVFDSNSGGHINWNHRQVAFEYDPDTLVGDLELIAAEGLLEWKPTPKGSGRRYQITQRTLDAVDNDFHRPRQQDILYVPSSAPAFDFSFITSADDRTLIERDYEEVRKCFGASSHKATIVLCGSIVEALLLAHLTYDEQSAMQAAATLYRKKELRREVHKLGLEEWSFYELISVAAEMSVLNPKDTKQLAQQLKDYRNLIHPGLEKRKGIEPSEGRALAAIALLRLIVEALSS